MPISSGAAGRMGAGSESRGSYLKMYLGTLSVEKRTLLENALEAERSPSAAGVTGGVGSGAQQGVQREKHTAEQKFRSDEDEEEEEEEEKANSGQLEYTPSKKSSTCTVL